MRNLAPPVLALSLLVAGCGSAPVSNPAPPQARGEYHGGPNALLLKYDANHDGTVTRDELIKGLKAEFAKLDTNGKGCLTPDQVEAINQQRVAADQSTATPLQDWNQDGCVDYREFSAAAYSLFDQLDLNGDGKVTPVEFNPRASAPPPRLAPVPMMRRRH